MYAYAFVFATGNPKQTIQIGVVGTGRDPLLEEFQSTQQSQDSRSHLISSVPEYLLAITQYFLTTSLLPNHTVCLLIVSSSVPSELVNSTFHNLVQEHTAAVIDALPNRYSWTVRNVLLPFSIPVLRVGDNTNPSSIPLAIVYAGFQNDFLLPESWWGASPFLISMTTQILFLYKTTRDVALLWGWRKIGIITTNPFPFMLNSRMQFVQNDLVIYFSEYNLTHPLETFAPFIKFEVQVFVYHGAVEDYFKVLKSAVDYELIGSK